jgi:2-polyprenyl-3-methyl-5-hydroxy-6-metoxy-1,4-benzoquinol methylase
MNSLSEVVSYNTAIKRNRPSAPLKSIECQLSHGDLILDYGCGKGDDVKYLKGEGYNVVGYDPHWNMLDLSDKSGLFDVVLCTYVLNVLPKKEEDGIISSILTCLSEDGKAFIAVRRDKFREGYSSRGFQRVVELDYPIFESKSGSYCIYQLSKQE